MIIACSGGASLISYNRIISSSNPPYTVTDKRTFKDPTNSSSRSLYALFIIDGNNALSLIYDSLNK